METLNSYKNSIVNYISDYTKNFSSARLFVLFGSFTGGLVSGFILGNYGRQIVILFAILTASIFILNNFQFLTVHITEIKSFFGITASNSVHDIINIYTEFVKKYIVEVIFFLVGFLIGWKIG